MSSEHVGHLDALRVPGPTCGYAPQLPADNVTRQPNCHRLVNGNVIIHESRVKTSQSINQSINLSSTRRRVVDVIDFF